VVDDRGRVGRIPYELCVLVTLRDAFRLDMNTRLDLSAP
jgi:hypothetical protein